MDSIALMNKDLKHIAFHEAGHAAMMLVSDKDTGHATLTPKDGMLAQVGEIYDEWAESEFDRAIVVCYAGKEAEMRTGGDGIGSQKDEEEANLYLKLIDKNEVEMRVKTNEMLDQH